MKVMMMWTSSEPEIRILTDALEKAGHTIVYWVGMYGGEEYCPPGAIFHDHYDAWDGKPAAAYATESFSPPSAKLIEEMYETESITLTMMDKRFDKNCVDERRRIYYQMLAYWGGILDRLQPEAILYPSVPHTVYNYVLYALAKKRGIATIMFEQTWVSDRLLMYRDLEEGSRELQEALAQNKDATVSPTDLSGDLQKYLRSQEKKEPVPVYVTEQKKTGLPLRKARAWVRGTLSGISRGVFFKELVRFLRKYLGPNLRKEYDRYISPLPPSGLSYVYVPLSFQPERTSCPQGGLFVDQILVVETVAAALPRGWKAVVKEHPVQWSTRSGVAYSSARYPGYYARIARIPNVVLAPIGTSSFSLMEGARALAASSGSAGWEGLLRGKPMLNFGYPWYRDCPGAHRVKDTDSCVQVLKKVEAGMTASRADVLRFLKSLDETSYHACMELFMEEFRTSSSEETMRLIAGIIEGELRRVSKADVSPKVRQQKK